MGSSRRSNLIMIMTMALTGHIKSDDDDNDDDDDDIDNDDDDDDHS